MWRCKVAWLCAPADANDSDDSESFTPDKKERDQRRGVNDIPDVGHLFVGNSFWQSVSSFVDVHNMQYAHHFRIVNEAFSTLLGTAEVVSSGMIFSIQQNQFDNFQTGEEKAQENFEELKKSMQAITNIFSKKTQWGRLKQEMVKYINGCLVANKMVSVHTDDYEEKQPDERLIFHVDACFSTLLEWVQNGCQ
jgi:hypothetical protein